VAQFLSRFGLKLLISVATIYLMFFVKIGDRTLFQHGRRIAHTPEARELGSDIATAVATATTKVTRKISTTIGVTSDDDN
jgi:hypothetical protein